MATESTVAANWASKVTRKVNTDDLANSIRLSIPRIDPADWVERNWGGKSVISSYSRSQWYQQPAKLQNALETIIVHSRVRPTCYSATLVDETYSFTFYYPGPAASPADERPLVLL